MQPRQSPSNYGLCRRERSNEARARDAAVARLWVIPTDELIRRIELAVETGDVMNAIQYARMLDRRAAFVRLAIHPEIVLGETQRQRGDTAHHDNQHHDENTP